MASFFSYLRAVVLLPLFVVHTLFCSIYIIFCAAVFRNRYLNHWNAKYVWSWPIVFLSGIQLEVECSRLTSKGGCLFLFNHSSYLDIPVLFCAAPLPFSFGAKIELFSIPFFGQAMKMVGVLPIARNNRSQAIRTYQKAEQRVANGECFALAPEGGRNREADALGDFKSGPFIFARNAKMPLVPVLMAGLKEVMPAGSLIIGGGRWRHKVKVRTLDMIPYEEIPSDDIKSFKKELRDRMNSVYMELLG